MNLSENDGDRRAKVRDNDLHYHYYVFLFSYPLDGYLSEETELEYESSVVPG